MRERTQAHHELEPPSFPETWVRSLMVAARCWAHWAVFMLRWCRYYFRVTNGMLLFHPPISMSRGASPVGAATGTIRFT